MNLLIVSCLEQVRGPKQRKSWKEFHIAHISTGDMFACSNNDN